MGLVADRPRGPPFDCEPAAMPLDPDIGREVDPRLWPNTITNPDHRIEEPEALGEPDALLFCGFAVDIRPNGHMLGVRLENNGRRRRIGPSSPNTHRARVTRAGRHTLAQ